MLLRDFHEDDVSLLIEFLNNEIVTKYLSSRIPQPYLIEDAKWWVNYGSKEGITKAIEVNGRLVGSVGVIVGEHESIRSGEIGYWLEERAWGKGIATEAVTKLTIDVFTDTQIARLFAPVYSPNKASMKVLEKCGFKLEGVLESAVFKNGVFLDEHLYAKVKV